MKAIYQVLTISLFSASAFNASASSFNYQYFEIGYIRSDIDAGPIDIDGDSLSLSGSFKITNKTFFSAAFQSGDYDLDLDISLFAIGAGFHTPIAPKADIVFTAHYLDAQIKEPSLGLADDTGYNVGLALRYASTPYVEINGGVGYVDLYDSSDTVIDVGARMKFGGDRSIGISYAKGDDTSDITLSFRMEM